MNPSWNRWNNVTQAVFAVKVPARQRALVCIVSHDDLMSWSAIAVEAAYPKEGEPAIDAVLADHAHAVIAREIRSFKVIKPIVETYAKAWKAGRALPACVCGEIVEDPRARRATRSPRPSSAG